MKKTIGILGVFAIAMAMFINVNFANANNEDLDLASMIAIGVANAEGSEGPDLDLCSDEPWLWCVLTVQGHHHSFPDCEPDRWYTLADCF
jgi:hypothetical protein